MLAVLIAAALGVVCLVVALLTRYRTPAAVAAGAALLAALAGWLVADARLRQCRDDRAASHVADLITCRRTLSGPTRVGGVLARRPLPDAPVGRELRVESPAFPNAATLPRRFGCRGDDVPPPLRIDGVPARARALAVLLVDNSDREWVVRWAVTDVPAAARTLRGGDAPPPGRVAVNSLGHRGYDGPCPAPGESIAAGVTFLVVALDRQLRLPRDATLDEVFEAVDAAALADGALDGQYEGR